MGSGGATYDSSGSIHEKMVTFHEIVIGPRTRHNPYQAELIAISRVLKGLPRGMRGRYVIIGTSNLRVVQAIARLKQQSGQQYIESILPDGADIKSQREYSIDSAGSGSSTQ